MFPEAYEWHIEFRHRIQGFGKSFRVIVPNSGNAADHVKAVIAARRELMDAGYNSPLDFDAIEIRRMGFASIQK